MYFPSAAEERLEDLCHRVSHSLAIITSHHHRTDEDLFRSWRGLVHECIPGASDLPHMSTGDSLSFARFMWAQYMDDCAVPEREDAFYDVEHAYSSVYYDLQEMLRLCVVLQRDLRESIQCIDHRLHVLYSRVFRRRVQKVLVEQQQMAQRPLQDGLYA